MLTRKTDIRARAIGWKLIFLDDHHWQDRRRWVWNVDDKSIMPSHANRSQVWTPLFWQAFWRSDTFFGKLMENLSQPVDKGSVVSPVSQKFIRIYTSLQEWRQIYCTIVHRYPRDFPIPSCSFKNFFDQNSFRFFYFLVFSFHFQRGILNKKQKI